MQYLLGYDIGTSSIKASLVEVTTGRQAASCFWPKTEARIIQKQKGWAEQDPEMWWQNLKIATHHVMAEAAAQAADVKAIGISYQMHGLVCVGRNGEALRDSIIWCDSRAVPYGQAAFDAIGHERCLDHLLGSPGNFTAAKLAWVKDNEPQLYEKIYKVMLPGDYIAMRLSGGSIGTTMSGLSEGMLWDFKTNGVSSDVMNHFGFDADMLSDLVPTFGEQCRVSRDVAAELGLLPGTAITYRAGDQPNNALSLGVLNPGEIAATAGTSGVVYGVLGQVNYDQQSRVNTFAHVNHSKSCPRLGVLLCINSTGILNAWMRRTFAPELSYAEINDVAMQAPAGSEGVSVIPFGNGAERILQNADIGSSIHGVRFGIHERAHLLRAAQEGIAFSFRYGIDIMRTMGMDIKSIHAGHANMFLSPLFRQALSCITGATIHIYDTDGAAGAAKGAGIGAGIYANADEALATLRMVDTVTPDAALTADYQNAYERWLDILEN